MAGQAMTSMASWAAMASMVEMALMQPRSERFPRSCWRSRPPWLRRHRWSWRPRRARWRESRGALIEAATICLFVTACVFPGLFTSYILVTLSTALRLFDYAGLFASYILVACPTALRFFAAAPRPRREEPGHQDEGPRAAHRRDPGPGPASQWVVSWRSMASDKFAEPVRRILPASQWVASWPASQWVVSLGACVSSDPLATPALAWSGDPAGARRLEPE